MKQLLLDITRQTSALGAVAVVSPARAKPWEARRTMTLQRWTGVAAVMLAIGGTGFLEKYLLLAIFDPDGKSNSSTLQAVTVLGLLLGELLLPLGVTALPALWLRGRKWWIVAVGCLLAVALFFVLSGLISNALGAPDRFADSDPLRLSSEGGLLLMGGFGVLTGVLVLRSARASAVGPPTPASQ